MLKTAWQIISREPEGGVGPWMLSLCGCFLVALTLVWLGSHVSWSWLFIGFALVALGAGGNSLLGGRVFATALRVTAIILGVTGFLVLAIYGVTE